MISEKAYIAPGAKIGKNVTIYPFAYFEYDKKYDNGQRGGEPDELVFRIYKPANQLDSQLEQVSGSAARRENQHFSSTLARTTPPAPSPRGSAVSTTNIPFI